MKYFFCVSLLVSSDSHLCDASNHQYNVEIPAIQYLIMEDCQYVKAGKDRSTWVTSPLDATTELPSGCILL